MGQAEPSGKNKVTRSEMPEGYEPVLAMALSPDGKTLAVGRGNRIEWFQVKEGTEKEAALLLEKTHSSPGHSDSIQSLAFSPDGKRLASGGFRRVLIWDPAKPKKAIDKIEDTFLGRQTALLYLSNPPRLLVADSLPSQLGRLHEIALDSGPRPLGSQEGDAFQPADIERSHAEPIHQEFVSFLLVR